MIKLFGKIVFGVLCSFFVMSVTSVVIFKYVPVPFTPLMVIRAVEGNDSLGWGWKHDWVDIEEISKYMTVAVVSSEDQKFFEHNGFDVDAILAAYEEAKSGKRVRGGSTISQQTAKNVFLWPESSWLRKGFEAYFTFWIELMWSKERILEVYLNSIEMGPGIYGVEAVAQAHFGCTAKELSRRNCALIAATLPNPRKFSSKSPSRYMYKRQYQILKEMRHVEPIVQDALRP